MRNRSPYSEEKVFDSEELNTADPARASVRLIGNLGRLQNGSRIEFEYVTTPTKLGSVIGLLNQKYSLSLKRENTLVLVNGVEANALDDLETVIKGGDEIVFLPMFHGGI